MAASGNSKSPHSRFAAALESARAGSDTALDSLLEDYRQHLLLTADRELGSDLRPKASASDLVQDTLIVAHQDFRSFTGTSQSALQAWLRQILAYRLQNLYRKYRRTEKRNIDREKPLIFQNGYVDESLAVGETPSTVVAAMEDHLRMHAAMHNLSEEHRLVVELRTWQKHSYEEIGRQLGRSPEAARKLWSRAIRQLGKLLTESE